MTPKDTWLICGHKVSSLRKNRGCICSPNDPTHWVVQEAIRRLAAEPPEVTTKGGRRASSPTDA